jgi:HEAT repeat protein
MEVAVRRLLILLTALALTGCSQLRPVPAPPAAETSSVDDTPSPTRGADVYELLMRVKSTDPHARAAAAQALGRCDDREFSWARVSALVAALKDDNSDVRKEAALALPGINRESQRAVPALVAALGDRDEKVAHAAAESLRRIDSDGALRQIYAQAPVGTPIAKLRAALESQGFECTFHKGKEPYLYCDKTVRTGSWLVVRRFQIIVFYRDEKVTEAQAFDGLIGP